jgi:cellulose synthase/poly-beta-1,6-N-acetylglucosamine synthase-like glycosyltransferase
VGGLCLSVPVITLFVQVVAASTRRIDAQTLLVPRPRVAVLVPAHNEQLVIRDTLASIMGQLMVGDRLVVVADNCSDHTAEAAKQEGAEVSIRCDPLLRGKGYALDHGIRFLESTEIPEVVIFVDADCQVRSGCIDRLARLCFQSMQPVQAAYLMNPPEPPRKTGCIITFAWMVRDFVRPLGWMRLSLPCQLSGSGMAFPWRLAQAADLASSNLVEDLKQGLDLALIGCFARFCPEAVVTSNVGKGGVPSYSQRARWEHGTLALIGQYLPKLFMRFLKVNSLPLLAVMLDLCVPPLALLALFTATFLLVTLLFAIAFNLTLPLEIAGTNCLLLFIAIVLAWWRHGQDILPFRWLAFAPIYAVRKIPLYLHFLLDRQRDWVRGERDIGR